MSLQRVTIIDRERKVVATAQVIEQEGYFAGLADLRPMSATLREQFEEYEETVSNQVFSLLDEIEGKIGAFFLRVVFEDGQEADLVDVQLYPSTKKVSFKVMKEGVRRTGRG
jgi:hypothetical protein